MKDWDYAITVQEMSKNGGPEKYIEKIRLHQHQLTTHAVNKKWLRGIIPTAIIITPFVVKGVYDSIQEHIKKNTVDDEEAKQAEKELIEYYESANIQTEEDENSEESQC